MPITAAKPCAADYAPYDQLVDFWHGYSAYGLSWENPYDRADTYRAQAWDRGLEYASRLKRWTEQLHWKQD